MLLLEAPIMVKITHFQVWKKKVRFSSATQVHGAAFQGTAIYTVNILILSVPTT
jgi:hypothetical protein